MSMSSTAKEPRKHIVFKALSMCIGWLSVAGVILVEVLLYSLKSDFDHHYLVAGAGMALVAATFLARFVQLVEAGDTPSIQRHWGGIGGGVSGWRMSISIVYLVCTIMFATLSVFILLHPVQSNKPGPGNTASVPSTPSSVNSAPADLKDRKQSRE